MDDGNDDDDDNNNNNNNNSVSYLLTCRFNNTGLIIKLAQNVQT